MTDRPPSHAWPLHLVDQDGAPVEVRIDEAHLEAHLADLAVDLATVARVAARSAAGVGPRFTPRVVDLGQLAGRSALRRLQPGDVAWWAPRPGRQTPSHLTSAPPVPTSFLTVVTRRAADGALEVATAYAGLPAPREIHDPDLPLEDLDESIAFWRARALSVANPPPPTARPWTEEDDASVHRP